MTSSSIEPLTIWGSLLGPNPSKVMMVLEELFLPYTTVEIPLSEVKSVEYTALNPNGRLPTLRDPNTGLTIWESGAIIEYLVEKYDEGHTISYPAGTENYYLCKQWLHFQMSGQGPYYGQAWWFKNFHPEKIHSAIDRYVNEMKRVWKVLDTHLEGRKYLVGNKCTYADIAFVPWQVNGLSLFEKDFNVAKEYPNTQAWMGRVTTRVPIAVLLKERHERITSILAVRAKSKEEDATSK